jgi:hypothetical protein
LKTGKYVILQQIISI